VAKQFDNNMRGALFVNERKTEEKQPDYTGSCEIEGVEYRLSAWKRETKAGAKMLSLSFQMKNGSPGMRRANTSAHQNEPDW
jgi:hypothetical protein